MNRRAFVAALVGAPAAALIGAPLAAAAAPRTATGVLILEPLHAAPQPIRIRYLKSHGFEGWSGVFGSNA